MKAVSISNYGSSSVLKFGENVETPTPTSTQVLVKVKATSVNPIDVMKREGYGRTIFEKQRSFRFPWILGSDVSGVVERVGSKVTKFYEGQEIWGCTSGASQGTYSEYAVFFENELTHKPKNLSHLEAASMPYVALSVWSALIRWAGLRPKDIQHKKIFVQAGSGGVGTFAIQLLHYWGAKIYTTCRSNNSELLISLGADKTIDYTREDFSNIVKDFNIALDLLGDLGGEESVSKTVNALEKSSSSIYITLNHPTLRLMDTKGVLLGVPSVLLEREKIRRAYKPINIYWSLYRPNISGLEEVTRLVEEQKIRPIIDSVFNLENIKEAHEKVATSHSVGKVVIKVSDD